MQKIIKWGILGCGDVTEVKSGPAFNLVDNSELVAVMRRNAEKAKDYASRHNVPKWYNNADDLINDANVNAIYVATPPYAHAELSIKALKAGKPVYVEKPMALNYKQCQQIIAASEEYNTPLFVAYYRRALPGFLKVKELIESGTIGKVKFAHINLYKSLSLNEKGGDMPWRVDPAMAGGGHFFDLASHQLDFFDFLFGPIKTVKAITQNQTALYKAEDMVSASFEFSENIVLNGKWCFTVPEFLQTDTMEIIGEKGKIAFSCFEFSPIQLETEQGSTMFEFEKPKHVQQPFIQFVVEQLLKNRPIQTNAHAGSRTNWVMDEVVKDFYR